MGRERGREREKQTDRQTDRDRETERHTDDRERQIDYCYSSNLTNVPIDRTTRTATKKTETGKHYTDFLFQFSKRCHLYIACIKFHGLFKLFKILTYLSTGFRL